MAHPSGTEPTTDELAAYFEVAEQITESLSEEDRIEIHKATFGWPAGTYVHSFATSPCRGVCPLMSTAWF